MATWNVGGKTPTYGLNLEELLQVEGSADIYVLGYGIHYFFSFNLLLFAICNKFSTRCNVCSSNIL